MDVPETFSRLKRDRRVCLRDAAVLIERERFGGDLQLFFGLDLHVADERKNVCFGPIDRACRGDLIGNFAFRRIDGHAHVLELVMTVRESDVTRGFD